MSTGPTAPAAAASAAASAAVASPFDTAALSLTSLNASSAARLALLTRFIAQPQVQQRYAAAESDYLSASTALHQAMEKRDKFKAACNSNPPAIRLPSSMQMHLVKHAKLTPVATDAAFYREQIAALELIESESAAKIYTTLLAAKNKHIAHLQAQANVHAFLQRTLKDYRQFVVAYAADFDNRYGAPPAAAASSSSAASAASAASSASEPASSFPINDAVNHFDSHLQQRVNELILLTVTDQQTRLANKAQAIVEDSKAQEQVLAGAHSGESIAMIVQQKVAPLQQQLRQLLQQQQRTAQQTPHSAAAVAVTAPRSNTQHKHSKSNAHVTFDGSSHSSAKPKPSSTLAHDARPRNRKRSADEPSEQLQITAQGHDRSVTSRGHAGHAANNDSSNSRSKNVRGGDRSLTPNRRTTKQQQSSPNPQREKSQGTERNSRGAPRPSHSRR